MHISRLGLTNFRRFSTLDLEIPEGPVILLGDNAAGKTSLLEAMYTFVIAKSFRAENERQLVNWNRTTENNQAFVNGKITKESATLNVIIGYQYAQTNRASSGQPASGNAGLDSYEQNTLINQRDDRFVLRKEIRVSRVKKSAAELVGMVNAVLFSAEDIQLIYGSPSLRRRYLDILLCQVDQTYLRSLQRYQRIVYQRNQLLKLIQSNKATTEELTFWNEGLVREGSYIVWTRYQAMGVLSALAEEQHKRLTGDLEHLRLEYKPSSPATLSLEDMQQQISDMLEQTKDRELRLGVTTIGPHRDDFKLMVGPIDMGIYSSRGQARTLALTLRLVEAAYLASTHGEQPILLLDDILSELDVFRRTKVLDTALQYQQTIITATDLMPFSKSFLAISTVFNVSNGDVTINPDIQPTNNAYVQPRTSETPKGPNTELGPFYA